MNKRQWEKVKAVFAAVVDLPNDERRKYLDEHCGTDRNLRTEVRSLLHAHQDTQHYIENQRFAATNFLDSDNYVGRMFGHYEILREIGRGGMGAVFLARRSDGEFEQQVALKIIRQTFADTELERRFRRERQILASLNHPNIAQLHDGGVTAGGEPFLVMEYVEGSPIDKFCEREDLSTNERLKLFLSACRAVSFAHQNLVVHRDLKPSNILVTNDGIPKLLDFGIAKLLDDEHADEQTQTNYRAFTPEYASPEQIAGEKITTASDVYSLGVLLSKLVGPETPPVANGNGFMPKRPGAAGDTDLKPNSTTPQSTRTLDRGSNTELNAIIDMARREEPQRRFASVQQLADDISRYLEGLPIHAQKDSFTYRATKFVNRNRIAVFAAILIFLITIGGVIATVWQARKAEANRERAERRFSDVRGLANALLNDITPKIERLEGSTEARQELVVQSLKYLDSLAIESAGDLALQKELAGAYEKVGVLQGDSRRPSLSDFRGAIASLEKALSVRRTLLEVNPGDAENRRSLADNLRLLAIRRMTQNYVEGGLKDTTEALQIYEKLVSEQPGSLELQRAFLETQVENGESHTNLSKYAAAIPLLTQAAAQIEDLQRAHPGDTDTERILATCLTNLGLALSWESRQPEAEVEMSRAVAITESLSTRFPNDTNLKQDLWKVFERASSIYEQIDDKRAFELCERSRRVVEEIIAADPANVQARHNLSKTFSRLGVSASHLGKPVEALGFLERSMAILIELQQKDPLNRGYDRDLSALYIRIGLPLLKQRDLTGALAAFEKSAKLFEKQLADDPENTIALRDSAIAYRHAGIVHKELALSKEWPVRQTHLQATKDYNQRALGVLLRADAQKALPESSRVLIETCRKEIEALDKMLAARQPVLK